MYDTNINSKEKNLFLQKQPGYKTKFRFAMLLNSRIKLLHQIESNKLQKVYTSGSQPFCLGDPF